MASASIGCWQDPDSHLWIVTLDTPNTRVLLSKHESKAEATEAAHREAETRDLALEANCLEA